MGGPLGVKVNPRRLSGTAERFVRGTAGKREDYPYLVKEVIPGNNIEDISPLRDVWTMWPLVNTGVGDQRHMRPTLQTNRREL